MGKDSFRAGEKIGDYEVIRVIEREGADHLLLAQDLSTDRKVTLRVINRGSDGQAANDDFHLKGAEIIRGLNHQNILAIYKIGKLPGHDFIAMEYIEGLPLRNLISSGKLSIDGILKIAGQILAGLEEADSKEVHFGDLNPGNIIVTNERNVKIISVSPISISSDEQRNILLADPSVSEYCSPEQLDGKEIDVRSNIYTFGVILYEMLSGRRPFPEGKSGQTEYDGEGAGLKPLPEIMGVNGDELNGILSRMLDINRDRRYQGIEEVKLDLEKLKTSVQTKPQKPVKKKDPWNWVVIAAVIILAIILFYGYIADLFK